MEGNHSNEQSTPQKNDNNDETLMEDNQAKKQTRENGRQPKERAWRSANERYQTKF